MDSLDAQSLLTELSENEACLPSQWLHGRDGTLGYTFMEAQTTTRGHPTRWRR